MEFAILGSGSRGNGTLVRDAETIVLIDCGFSRKETQRRLSLLGLDPEQISAIVVTHEHADHVAGVLRNAQACQCPVWATCGTAEAAGLEAAHDLQRFSPHREFQIGSLTLQPYPVPHDAREPAQFVVGNGSKRLGILSDAGSVTSHMREMLDACDGLLLEFNHCPQMLERGPYPPALRARVGGGLGHLSNQQSGALLRELNRSDLQQLVLTHISQQNNSAERALREAVAALGEQPDWLRVAEQDAVMQWRALA